MGNFTIYDGLMLTIVSMIVVFFVLTVIWGLIELVAKIIAQFEEPEEASLVTLSVSPDSLRENTKHKQVAEIMALILASEDQPDRKFEIVESKRIK